MKGSIIKRGTDRYALVFLIDDGVDALGKPKRGQKWIAHKSTVPHTKNCGVRSCTKHCKSREEAEKKLRELVSSYEKGLRRADEAHRRHAAGPLASRGREAVEATEHLSDV